MKMDVLGFLTFLHLAWNFLVGKALGAAGWRSFCVHQQEF